MARLAAYLRDRLSEAGTMRSLIWVVIGISTGARAETMIEDLAALALVALGGWSALKSESK